MCFTHKRNSGYSVDIDSNSKLHVQGFDIMQMTSQFVFILDDNMTQFQNEEIIKFGKLLYGNKLFLYGKR